MKTKIRKITLSSIFAGLSTALIVLGSVMEIFDLTTAAFCSLLIYISMIEIKGKYPFLIYLTTCVLSLIISPMTTATLYYVAFFGYYPIIRHKLKRLKKTLSKLICFGVFNASMLLLFCFFKAVFSYQNEPIFMYVVLLVTANIFFFCFDYALDVFAFIYIKKIRPKLNLNK